MATIHTYTIGASPSSYYARTLAKSDALIRFLDFQTMSQDATLRDWLWEDQDFHDLADVYGIYWLNPAWCTDSVSWLRLYDGLIFIEQSTSAVGLP